MAKPKWNIDNIPDQSNRVVIITGASSGLGKEATRVMASKNARVIMAVRDTEKGQKVAAEIKNVQPDANIDIQKLDLGSLDSIHTFAKAIKTFYHRVDILINNAGVMACPFSKTQDGFEIQMGTNHLGHFALTGLLMPLLQETKDSRIVATSSAAHRQGDINFEDINWEQRKYNSTKAYADSKLANLYFTYELAKKLKTDPNAPIVITAHPGWASTDLKRHSLMFKVLSPIFSQSVQNGVLPTLRAATDRHAQAGDYYGPSGFMEIKGSPTLVSSSKMSHNEANGKLLWALSEKMTGVKF